MDKRKKLISLLVAIAILIGGCIGGYFLLKPSHTAGEHDVVRHGGNYGEDISSQVLENSGKSTTAAEADHPQGSGANSSSDTRQSTQAPTTDLHSGDDNRTEPDNNTVTVEVDDGFVCLSGGTFTMGSPTDEAYRESDEASHSVTVSAFYVDPYEVTQGDYEAIMGANPSYFSGAALPVENVTWYQAIEYCNKKSVAAGLTPVYTVDGTTVTWDRSANGYRLLTEAEWEYADRAGTTTVFPTGKYISTDEANYQGSYPYMVEEHYSMGTIPSDAGKGGYYGTNRGKTVRVDSLTANGFGLYNMNGNVSEWVFDYYGEYQSTATDPTGAASGSLRVNRGGSYNDFAKHLSSAYRSATNPVDTDRNLGFRIARNAVQSSGTVTTTYSVNISIPSNPKVLDMFLLNGTKAVLTLSQFAVYYVSINFLTATILHIILLRIEKSSKQNKVS